MPRFFISFDDGAMDHIAQEDFAAVGDAAHAVVSAAQQAGVWITGGGFHAQTATTVSPTGVITSGPTADEKQQLGGFSIVDVASRSEAEAWAAKMAAACRCSQEVREIMPDDRV